MASTFLDRNKKKSLLAALLLFLRERKMLVLLVLLVLCATTVFVSPTSWLGTKLGAYASKWGMNGYGGDGSRGDLLAAFRTARTQSRLGGMGWGAFFGRGDSIVKANSLEFVKGSKADLTRIGAGGAAITARTVAGIVDPADAKDSAGDGVAIAPGDLGGERAGLLPEAFAGGFVNGLLGGAASGDAALSGGAFASKDFFGGVGGAVSTTPGSQAKAALPSLSAMGTPTGVKGGKKGSLSAFARGVVTSSMKNSAAAAVLGGSGAYTQLAEGSMRDTLGTTYCQPPACPAEYAAVNTGAIYDGNDLSQGLLTSSDPGADAAGLISPSVVVPPTSAGGSSSDAQNVATCEAMVQQCAQSKTAPIDQEAADETQLTAWFNQMPAACSDHCHCDPCNKLQGQITGLCGGDLTTQQNAINAPCAPLPDYCGALGITAPNSATYSPGAVNLCQSNLGACSCGFLCSLGCFF
ncbi:MAG: hypothetical protein ACHQ49_01595 [Elusimicrobiota bacterium]